MLTSLEINLIYLLIVPIRKINFFVFGVGHVIRLSLLL